MAGKMDRTVVIVSAAVGSLGLLSAILGFADEFTKITIADVRVFGDECLYPRSPSLGLGLCSAIFLLTAQVTASAVGGGCCYKSSAIVASGTKRVVGIVCGVVSWIAAAVACALFVEGATWNADEARDTAPVCYVLKDGVFTGAAALALATSALGITSHVALRRPQIDEEPAGAETPLKQPLLLHARIAVGHPQFPRNPQWHAQV